MKKPSSSSSSKFIKRLNLILAILIIIVLIVAVIYALMAKKAIEEQEIEPTKKVIINNQNLKDEEIHKYFEEKTENTKEDYLHPEITTDTKPDIKQEINKTINKPITDNTIKEKIKINEPKMVFKNAKLVIIIDDITLKSQVDDIVNIGYPINLALMPPTYVHPQSAAISHGLKHYMVHLPLQANAFELEEENTLHIGDSYDKIDSRIAKIKELFPNAKYINNHTGSKFSQDKNSTDKLLKAIAKYNFSFLDSKTIGNSTLCISAKEEQVKCLQRNVFLDNEQNFGYIQNQLKKAIAQAKKTGLSIAIGHPHKETLAVLKDSKELLSGVELLYIENL